MRDLLVQYAKVSESGFRQNAAEFLRLICPVAAELGVKLCIHPDDPPRPLLGLPRIVSTADDLEWLMAQSDLDANGITFCTGALGVRADNDGGDGALLRPADWFLPSEIHAAGGKAGKWARLEDGEFL